MEALSVLAGLMTGSLAIIGYLVASLTDDASTADVLWGLYFVDIAICLLLNHKQHSNLQYLASGLIIIWGLRLSYHIARRKIGKPEDWRYQQWRQQWGRWFALRSLFQNFILQAFLASVIAFPLIIAANSAHDIGFIQYLGLVVWLIGFGTEAIADSELKNFRREKRGPKDILTTGLWHYSRHPNYFGEITQWWGIWLIIVGLPYGLWGLISPITITCLILFVSGIPLLERRYKDNSAYQKYARKTSILVPLPPKK